MRDEQDELARADQIISSMEEERGELLERIRALESDNERLQGIVTDAMEEYRQMSEDLKEYRDGHIPSREDEIQRLWDMINDLRDDLCKEGEAARRGYEALADLKRIAESDKTPDHIKTVIRNRWPVELWGDETNRQWCPGCEEYGCQQEEYDDRSAVDLSGEQRNE